MAAFCDELVSPRMQRRKTRDRLLPFNGFFFRLRENFGCDRYLSSRGRFFPSSSVILLHQCQQLRRNGSERYCVHWPCSWHAWCFGFHLWSCGREQEGRGIVICNYPHDPTVGLGSLSVVCLFLSCICGLVSVFYPYKGRAVPVHVLARSPALVIFLAISMALTFLAEGLMIWATVTESLHRKHNVHHDLTTDCPTAKTGLFGGAAFLALDASLFWLICQMLTSDARADYEDREEMRGKYGQILTTDYTAMAAHVQARA